MIHMATHRKIPKTQDRRASRFSLSLGCLKNSEFKVRERERERGREHPAAIPLQR